MIHLVPRVILPELKGTRGPFGCILISCQMEFIVIHFIFLPNFSVDAFQLQMYLRW